MDDPRPELITHSPSDSHSFEDTLRDVLRTSPYIVFSVVIHSVVLLVLWLMPSAELELDEQLTIEVGRDQVDVTPLVDPPPPPTDLVKPTTPIENPTVSVDPPDLPSAPTDFPSDVIDAAPSAEPAGITGLGGGPQGKLGGRPGGENGGGYPPGEPFNDAVRDALLWLSFHQTDLGDGLGYWSGSAFDLECGRLDAESICDGLSSTTQHDVGLTGLALLAFLGAGNTHTDGEFAGTVKRSLKYLLEGQDMDGCLAPRTSTTHTYDHIIATLALTEAYALAPNRSLKKGAIRAHQYMYALRNPGAAWRYAETHPEMLTHENDVSVTGWAILAMTLAKDLPELPFEAQALDDALVFIEEMTDATGRTGYIERGGPPSRLRAASDVWDASRSESMTAVGVLSRIFADPEFERPGMRASVAKGVGLILAQPMAWDDGDIGTVDFYYWYYATYALHQFSITPEGRAAWKTWQGLMRAAVLDRQVQEGDEKGSWPPQVDPWGSIGGRVYSTAILALCMEVFYRYDTVIGSHSPR